MAKFKKGDKVTVRLKATDEEFEGTAYVEAESTNIRVLGVGVLGLAQAKFELLAIRKPEPPKPQVPTVNGSVVRQKGNGMGGVRGSFRGTAPVTAVLVGGKWVWPASGTGSLKPEMWSSGFDVLYDAGKDATQHEPGTSGV